MALLAAGTVARAGGLTDPFALRNQLPIALVFLDLTPAPAALVAPGEPTLSVRTAYESTHAASDDLLALYRQDGFATYDGEVTLPVLSSVAAGTPSGTAFFLDGETLRTTVESRLRLGPRFEAGIEIPFLGHGGGHLDSFIEAYHETLNLPDGGRPPFARDRFRAGYVGDGEAVFFDRTTGGLRPGDVVLTARAALLGEERRGAALTASLLVKAPTGDADELRGSGAWDFGLGLQASRRFRRSAVHAGAQISWLGGWEVAPGLPLRDPWSLFAAWAISASPRSALVVQLLGSSGAFPQRAGNDLGTRQLEIAAGMRHALPGGGMALEWALIENLKRSHNTPDVGVFLGLAARWGRGGDPPEMPPAAANPLAESELRAFGGVRP